MKTKGTTLDAWTIEGTDDYGIPLTKRIELSQDSFRSYGVRLLIDDEVVDKERFDNLAEAQEYADEMRQSVADYSIEPRVACRDVQPHRLVDIAAGMACVEAISQAIGQGRAGDLLKVLKASGFA